MVSQNACLKGVEVTIINTCLTGQISVTVVGECPSTTLLSQLSVGASLMLTYLLHHHYSCDHRKNYPLWSYS